MNDHFSTRKPRVHSEKEDLEFCAFGLMESDVEFPKADEINRTVRYIGTVNGQIVIEVGGLGEQSRRVAVGTMTRIRLTCSSVGCEEQATEASSAHRVANSQTSSPQSA